MDRWMQIVYPERYLAYQEAERIREDIHLDLDDLVKHNELKFKSASELFLDIYRTLEVKIE